jgi:hypothetical protein
MKQNKNNLDVLLAPSWLSGLTAIVAGLTVVIGIILVFSFNNSVVQQQITGWQDVSTPEPTLTLPGGTPPGTDTNSLQNTWPLLGFWMVVGLAAYFIVESGARGLSEIAEFKKELGFVHTHRDALIRNTVETALLRLAAAIIWLIFIGFFFRRIVPYSIEAAHASVSDLKAPTALLDGALSFSIIVLGLHIQVVLLRLMSGRLRLFSRG